MQADKRGKKVIGIGLACLDHLMVWDDAHKPVSVGRIVQYRAQGGGPTATALVAVARLGGAAEFWGAVGDDAAGAAILHGLRAEGVEVQSVVQVAGGQGPVFLVCVDQKTGERYIHGTASFADPAERLGELERIGEAGCVLVDGWRRGTALPAVAEAQRRGVPVVADICHVDENTRALLEHVDYAIASEQCFASLGAHDPATACRMLCERGAKYSAVTLGRRGVIALVDGRLIEQAAFAVDVVDTTGAGDVFHGAFCVGLIRGLPVEANLAFAAATAALKCRALGGRTGIPKLNEVLEFLRLRGVELGRFF